MSETPKPRACYMRHGKVYDAQLKYVNATPAVAVPQEAYNKARGLLSRIADRGGSDTAYLDTIEVLALLPEVPHD